MNKKSLNTDKNDQIKTHAIKYVWNEMEWMWVECEVGQEIENIFCLFDCDYFVEKIKNEFVWER